MTEENISKTSRLKNIDETRNKFNDAINQKSVMSKKPKKNCDFKFYRTPTCCSFHGDWMCFSFCFGFVSWYFCGVTSFAVRLNIFTITAGLNITQ